MSGAKVCDIFAQKTMYLRPERRISVDTSVCIFPFIYQGQLGIKLAVEVNLHGIGAVISWDSQLSPNMKQQNINKIFIKQNDKNRDIFISHLA